MKLCSPSSQKGNGFSLIEVVIALGVLSFAMVPLMALLPMGFSSFRLAMDQTVEAAILQNLRSVASQITPNQTSLPDMYYNQEGTSSQNSSELYRVTIVNLGGKGTIATPDGTAQDFKALRTVEYRILHQPSGRKLAGGVIHTCMRSESQ